MAISFGLGICIITLVIILRSMLQLITVRGSSMEPTYKDGDRVMLFKWWPVRYLKYGDVVVTDFRKVPGFKQPQVIKLTIKRVIALQGDFVDPGLPENQHLVLNSDIVDEIRPFAIPPGFYLVGADAPMSPFKWGPIPAKALVGIVVAKLKSSVR